MRCHICGSDYDGPHCPHCVTHLPAPSAQAEQAGEKRVVDAEIVHDGQHSGGQSGQSGFHSQRWNSGSSQGFTWTSWQSSGSGKEENGGNGGGAGFGGFSPFGGAQGQFSGLPFWITFGLMLACGVQYGFLAAIGFLFFYVLGSALGMFFTVSRLLNGMAINPWAVRICNWAACWLLTTWLAR